LLEQDEIALSHCSLDQKSAEIHENPTLV